MRHAPKGHNTPARAQQAHTHNPGAPTCAICRSFVCMTWLYVCLPFSITSCVSASACRSEVISWRWALCGSRRARTVEDSGVRARQSCHALCPALEFEPFLMGNNWQPTPG